MDTAFCPLFLFHIAIMCSKLMGCKTDSCLWTRDIFNVTSNLLNSDLECNVGFNTNRIQNEFVISFHHYYLINSRIIFINAAFKKAKIEKWNVLQRINPAYAYPSDFDIVQTEKDLTSDQIFIIKKHPVIKSVTFHHSVKRTLSYNLKDKSKNVEDNPFQQIDSMNGTEFQFKLRKNQIKWQSSRRLLRAVPRQITTILRANELWDLGITGRGVKVAVFDTGLSKSHPHFRRVKERTNWTNEKSLDDGVSHGTFVAGVIASGEECLGFAPDAELHIYRVFTNTQVSYTSWFLDAFNYAILKKIKILNLSIGGPDFLDYPFVEKVLELSANKVIMVSAIGNDGPLYGTLNNPGDQSDVIGVGGINFDENVAKFSSRGMTTWELPRGYGRLKPDIVTYGSQVKGSNVKGGCRSLSGTSVASPVVAGAVTLLTSGVLDKLEKVNPSSMKQVLHEGATRLIENNMFEQGHGKLNILRSMELLTEYVPKVTLSPAYLDFSESYMWPYSSQYLYCDCEPIIVNVTILNGIAVTGYILEEPSWHPYSKGHGTFLNVSISVSKILWPWAGWMAVYIAANEKGCDYEGTASGYIKLTVQSQTHPDTNSPVNSTVFFPISVKLIPKPPRHKRILWDQFHSLRYPPGYLPRDNLKVKSDPLDWKSDHIHTNFREMYNHLRNSGYYVDVLRGSFDCFDATKYGTILIVDPEEEYFDEEIVKLQNDVYNHGLSIIVFADWYNTTVMKKIKFFDENTRQWWIPDTGGSNIPALNELLHSFGIAFGDFVAEGYYAMGDHSMYYASGATIVKFPATSESLLIGANLHDQGLEIIKNINLQHNEKYFVPILGLLHSKDLLQNEHTQDFSVPIAVESSYEDNTIDQMNMVTEQFVEKNPLLNKRILLKRSLKEANSKYTNKLVHETPIQEENKNNENSSFRPLDMKNKSQIASKGRIAVFGDSNCLDAIHLEKPCYWLLDALLEFTMNSHVSSLLQDLSKKSSFTSLEKKRLPLRLLSNNLHLYSKVLDPENMFKKRPLEECEKLRWAVENINQTDIQKSLVGNEILKNNEANKNVQRKLESDKVGLMEQHNDPDIEVQNQMVPERTETKKAAFIRTGVNTVKHSFSTSYSLIIVIILSFIILASFIKRLKRQRCIKLNIQSSLSQQIF